MTTKNKTKKRKKEYTMIRVDKRTHNRLKKLKYPKQSFDKLFQSFLKKYK